MSGPTISSGMDPLNLPRSEDHVETPGRQLSAGPNPLTVDFDGGAPQRRRGCYFRPDGANRSVRSDSDRTGAAPGRNTKHFWSRSLIVLAIMTGPIMATVSVASASSTKLYVSMLGTDTSNNCQTQSNPCAGINFAQSQAESGDTIDVGSGIFKANLYTEGAPDSPNACADLTVQGSHHGSFNTTTLEPLNTNEAVASTNRCALTLSRLIINGQADQAIDAGYGSVLKVLDSTIINSSVGVCGCGPDAGAEILNSTLSNNVVAVEAGGPGGVNIDDSTISLNGVGVDLLSGGNLNVIASTIANNGTGIEGLAPSGAVGIVATIVSHNQGQDCVFSSGLATDEGYNIDQDGTCGFGAAASSLSGVDPRLGPLAWNGGPTFTMAPRSGSPAIDAIPVGATALHANLSAQLCPGPTWTDKRGVTQSQSRPCDVGAVEARTGFDGVLASMEKRHRQISHNTAGAHHVNPTRTRANGRTPIRIAPLEPQSAPTGSTGTLMSWTSYGASPWCGDRRSATLTAYTAASVRRDSPIFMSTLET